MSTEAMEVRAIATVQYQGLVDIPEAVVSKPFTSISEARNWARYEVEEAHGVEDVSVDLLYDSLTGNQVWAIRSPEGPVNALVWTVPFPKVSEE